MLIRHESLSSVWLIDTTEKKFMRMHKVEKSRWDKYCHLDNVWTPYLRVRINEYRHSIELVFDDPTYSTDCPRSIHTGSQIDGKMPCLPPS